MIVVFRQPSELVVISDTGEVYFNDAAWLVCLFALVDCRAWSFRMAQLAPSCTVEDVSRARSGEVERHHGRATRAADFLQ
jgi:hypothetical protein